ncbi:hypothetical protein DVH05_009088 [Phytophthora capsici]|nr:hypothetical protein DVH05_009088 [Phytophthora capsici]
MTAEGVAYLLSELSVDADLTLTQLADKLSTHCFISVSPQTIKNHLDASTITMKQFHKEPQYMNTDVNKHKRRDSRREYLIRLQELQASRWDADSWKTVKASHCIFFRLLHMTGLRYLLYEFDLVLCAFEFGFSAFDFVLDEFGVVLGEFGLEKVYTPT